ncbi:ATP-binding cassette sub-family C member 4-like isoform X3 [Apostichopus japonicus]|uniref:ATP-binding cassette sub-family C member 4-like isoform X3 n=1 Tax=Stichopus japonicus TaxID=307972 RepID=UPI003AB7EFE2
MLNIGENQPDGGKPNPYKHASFFTKLYFCWLLPFLRYGHKHNLEESDVYGILSHDSIKKHSVRLEREWERELLKQKETGKSPSLGWALFRIYRVPMLTFGFISTLEECVFKIAQPILLAVLVQYFGDTPSITQQQAYLCAAGIGFCSIMLLTMHHFSWFVFSRTGMHMRISVTALVYKKSLNLSNAAFQQTTVGQIVNLLSNDVNRFDRVTLFMHYLWIAPIQILTMLAVLWYQMGPLSLIAIGTLSFLIPVQAFMAKMFSSLRAKTAVLTDERVRIMNEIISANKVIKVHGWEESFTAQIKEARRREIRPLLVSCVLQSVSYTVYYQFAILMTGLSFLISFFGDSPLMTEGLFLVMLLTRTVKHSAFRMVPLAVRCSSEGLIAVQRMQQFLLLEEVEAVAASSKLDEAHSNEYGSKAYVVLQEDGDSEEDEERQETFRLMEMPQEDDRKEAENPEEEKMLQNGDNTADMSLDRKETRIGGTDVIEKPETVRESDEITAVIEGSPKAVTEMEEGPTAVTVEGLSGSWKTNTLKGTILEDVSFTVKKGELVAVVGPVGAGKSSMLMALLGELPDQSGECFTNGTIAYSSQQPWLFSGTFQQNILFAEQFEKKKYWEAVSVCALNRDIANLPEGDLTLVGERGVQLSGGQKARVSLARAVYSDADIYLLDDPLSAVDTSVGRHLFDRCIKGILRNKAVILVTHQLQYLSEMDKIVVLKEGQVTSMGSYMELVESGVDFAALMIENKQKDEEEEKEEDKEDEGTKMTGRRNGRGGGGGGGKGGSSAEDIHPKSVKAGKVDKERKESGTVGARVYRKYLMAGTHLLPLILFMVVNFSAQGFMVASDWWLTQWAYIEEQCVDAYNESICLSNTSVLQEFANIPPMGRSFFVVVYVAFLSCLVIFGFIRTIWLFFICIRASKNLHNQMFSAVIRAPMHFFDTNTSGRILNRFAKDIGLMDENLPPTIADFNQICVQTLCSVVVVCIFNPLVIILVFPLILLLVYTRSYYLASSRDIKRIEAVARSPVFTHLSASLQGLATIRAYGAQQRFVRDFYYHQDNHTKSWMMFLFIARWFGVMLDAIVTIFVVFVAMVSVFSADLFDLNPGEVGLSLTYAISLLTIFQWGVRQSTEIENWMTSTERVIEYSELKPEAALETDHETAPGWPMYGNVTMEAVSLKYSEDGPTVLKKLRFSIRSKEKIGIVGRTGAGKSSLTAALLRLVEPSGVIKIDGEDITKLGLHQLRKNLSYIPQDPVLFRTTLRRNLDPFAEYSDEIIWRTLKEVQLDSAIEEYPEKLEMQVNEEGKNFSVGQRQLLCLARAILRQNKILIIDEATANVDLETDQLIQATVHERFQECTVLTVAHRLNTIMDSDRVLVMEEGKVIEYDEPFLLLQQNDGFFTRMVEETGSQESTRLWEIAKNEYRKRYSDDPYKLLRDES